LFIIEHHHIAPGLWLSLILMLTVTERRSNAMAQME
jgi:hypothetical protein